MTSIINISPTFPSVPVEKLFSGDLIEGRKVVTIRPIMWSTTDRSCVRVMKDLDKAIHDACRDHPGTPEKPTRVVGYSIWSQVIYKWLREMGPVAYASGNINPETIEFFTIGCPEQKFTGSSFLFPHLDRPIYPGTTPYSAFSATPRQHHGGYNVGSGLPLSLPWRVYCISNQFDGWSDAPALYDKKSEHSQALDQRKKCFGITWRQPWFEPGNLFARLRTMNGPHGIDAYCEGGLFVPSDAVYIDPESADPAYPHGEAIYIWRRTSYAPILTGKARSEWNANYERPVHLA